MLSKPILIFSSCVIYFLSSFIANAQWIQTEGPYDRIWAYDLVEVNGSLVAGTQCGVYIKQNNATQWNQISYAFTPKLFVKGDSVFTSFYHGLGVIDMTQPNPTEVVYPYASAPFLNGPGLASYNNVLYVSSNEGIYFSTDWGRTITLYNTGLPVDTVNISTGVYYRLYVSDLLNIGKSIFCSTQKGVYKSDSLNAGWQKKNTGLSNDVLTNLYEKSGVLYGISRGTLYSSLDTGSNWTVVSGFTETLMGFEKAGGVLYLSTYENGVLYSNNNGTTWQPLNTGLPSLYTRDIKFLDGKLYVIASGEAFYEFVGGVWQKVLRKGLICTDLVGIAKTDSNVFISDIFRTYKLKNNNTWEMLMYVGNDSTVLRSLSVFGDTLFAPAITSDSQWFIRNPRIYFSIDEGQNWDTIPTPQVSTIRNELNVLKHRNNLYLWNEEFIFKSSDFGQNWLDVTPTFSGFCTDINDLILFNDTLHAATCEPRLIRKFNSVDNSWTSTYISGSIGNEIYKLFSSDTTLYVQFFGRMYGKGKSSSKWTDVSAGYGNEYIAAADTANGYLFLAGDNEIYYHANLNEPWLTFTDSLSSHILSSGMVTFNDTLYISTFYHGVYKHALPSRKIGLNEKLVKSDYVLYPNPANDIVKIWLNPNEMGSYSIYNQSGKLLQQGELKKETAISVRDLTSGLYLISIHLNGVTRQSKLIVQH